MQVRRYAGIFLILLIALAPLVAGCDVLDTDDDAEETETPTEEAEETPEDGETPEVTEEPDETAPEGTPEETATPDDEEPAPTDGTPEDDDGEPEDVGQEIFDTTCAACHQPDGEGIEDIYPALAESPFVTAEDPGAVINVVLTGRGGMPRFGGAYSDEEIAAIVSYIRTNLGNDASEVTPEDVQEERQALESDEEDVEETGGGQSEETEGDDEDDDDESEDNDDGGSEDDESN